jgi:hypothetical protein
MRDDVLLQSPLVHDMGMLTYNLNLFFVQLGHSNKQTNKHEIGLDIQASTEDYLRDLKKNHKKKGKGMFGSSQCDNARKGKKV